MNSKAQYISIFDKSPEFAFSVNSSIAHSSTEYLAIASTSFESFKDNCRALGRPTLVVINETMIRETEDLIHLKSMLSNSGIRWLATECGGEMYSEIRHESENEREYKDAIQRFESFLNSNSSVLPQPKSRMVNQLYDSSSTAGKMEWETKKVTLTPRQLEVYDLVMRGLSNKRIARSLGIAECTVKEHITGILQKLGFKTRLEALSKAFVAEL